MTPNLAAQLGLGGRGQEKADKLLAGDGGVVFGRLRVLLGGSRSGSRVVVVVVTHLTGAPPSALLTLMAASSCSASCSMPKKRASSRTPGRQKECRKLIRSPSVVKEIQHEGLTSDVDALVDDELAVPQVVEDGLKVLGAAVDEEGAALVPRVAPHIWSGDNNNNGATWWSAGFHATLPRVAFP